MIRALLRTILAALSLAAIGETPALAQGTIPLALVQQFDKSGNGQPLAGCLVYFFVAGTVATPQNAFQDFGLTQPLPNPLSCDQGGRIPMFWLANGLIHVRLTDASGVVQVDTTMQVLGPSSGGGGGGGTVDPTSVASTGDIKFRPTAETLTGWVILNGQNIGSATSGATQRANADTQNLFVYLWTNCTNPHCPVSSGRGATALADFNANKTIELPDMRSRAMWGRDCMGGACAGILQTSDVTSGGSDGVDTPMAQGGFDTSTIAKANIPNYTLNNSLGFSGNTQTWSANQNVLEAAGSGVGFSNVGGFFSIGAPSTAVTPSGSITGSVTSGGSGTPLPVMNPFALGTWYEKL